MEGFSWLYAVWAIFLGALSAVSLPLGSLVGLSTLAGFLAVILFKLPE